MEYLSQLFEKQKAFFEKGTTLNPDFRLKSLLKLKSVVRKNEKLIIKALRKDLYKPEFEAYVSEIGHFYSELDNVIKNLKKWAAPQRRRSPFIFFPASSFIYPEPYGNVLIISPWNYPFDLSMVPLIGAVAAGNVVILKPSEYSPTTASIIRKIVLEAFEEDHVAVVLGDADVAKQLLEFRFDYIFYTGNPYVGKYIMEKAAQNLTPCTLELGGKSPVILWEVNNFECAVRRIVWGKFFNAGQTCIAPDYVILRSSDMDRFIETADRVIEEFFGSDPYKSKDYARIVNVKHFDRIAALIDTDKVLIGGEMDRETLYISPTIVKADVEDKCMAEEIFGPVLPVIDGFDDLESVINFINSNPKPLAIYIFTDDEEVYHMFLTRTFSGSLVKNDVLIQFSSLNLPFGGVGQSGFGKYHGKKTFETFVNYKAVVKRPLSFDLPLRYPPYSDFKLSFIKRFWHYLTRSII